jgi:hypothetical protein
MRSSLSARILALALGGLTALAPRGAAAAIAPEARPVVERYLRAIGGSEAFQRDRSTRVKGTLQAFGLSGSLEQWTVRPDRSASVTVIGPFTLREGDDGTRVWRVDQNGKFALRDGKDRDDARASTWFANELWLTSDQGGGQITWAGRERDSLDRYQVLEIAPPVGRSRRMWFSDRTGLIDREITRQDNQTITSRQRDYRSADGRLRPFRNVIEVEGMPLNTATIVIDSLWSNADIDSTVFSPPASAVSDWRFLRGPGPARLAFEYSLRHVWLKVSVNGAPPADFLLDTGASITVIDSAYAAAHGIPAQGRLQASGAGAAGGAALGHVDSLRVAGADGDGVIVSDQKVAVLALSPNLEPFFWRGVAGVLGYDFISRFVVEVDYDRALLVLHDPRTFRYQGAGKSIPLTFAGNIPVAKARIDGQFEGEFRLDVGSGSTVDIHGPFAKQHDLESRLGTHYEVTGGGFGGTFASTVARMKKMEIGPFAWDEPVVLLSGATSGGLASEDYAGNIGNHILERFKATFDYEHHVVYLEPGARFGQRDRFSSAGFLLGKIAGKVRALQVLEGSPGARAGLRANDEVVGVDRKPLAAYTVDQLSQLFERGADGEKHTLEVVRDGRRKKLKLVLRQML